MEITLTSDQEDFIKSCVVSGRCSSVEDAVLRGIATWIAIERDRIELIAAIEEGEADLAAGRYTEYDEEGLRQVFEQIKRDGRQRLERASS